MSRPSLVLFALGALVTACGAPPADANGRFEATEITVSAEAAGTLLALSAREGDAVTAQGVVGVIDTLMLTMQRDELDARAAALRAQREEVAAQGRALEAQACGGPGEPDAHRTPRGGRCRDGRNSSSATRVTRPRWPTSGPHSWPPAARCSSRRMPSPRSASSCGTGWTRRSCTARSPAWCSSRYVEPGELVQAGTPIFKVAALDSLVLRAYVSDAQLASVSLGQMVTVQVDDGAGGFRTMPGRITWIAQSAEFTPTPIQTREERVSQVYAVKIAVANGDGRLRIGMPGELLLPVQTADRGRE